MELRVLTWNLFHGRDHAPDPALHTWRSRLLRNTTRSESHAQVNRDLFEQFAGLLRDAAWDIALLQECPPRWAEALATACEAEPHLVLTARNLPAPLSSLPRIGARLNPDLIASWEGGSNLTLVRSTRNRGRAITARRELTLARRPEARRMAVSHLGRGLCVANLHASTDRIVAEREVDAAARQAREWAGGLPLIFGGDLNLRPARSAALFQALERNEGLAPATAPDAIDHLLLAGGEVVEPPTAWEPSRREVPDPTAREGSTALPIRLSDHAPVEACFRFQNLGA